MRHIKFRAWVKPLKKMAIVYTLGLTGIEGTTVLVDGELRSGLDHNTMELMQYTGLKDKNGKEIFEGDIIGEEGVYHFIERKNWEPASGVWKIIGEKTKNFNGMFEEKYIAGYELIVVEWKDKSCGFEPFADSEKNCGHCGCGRNPENSEVIGNIYENPELLNK